LHNSKRSEVSECATYVIVFLRVRTRTSTRNPRIQALDDIDEYFSSQENSQGYSSDQETDSEANQETNSEGDTALPAPETLPVLQENELAAAERAFIEERGYIDIEAVERSYLQQSITRRVLNRGRPRPRYFTRLSADSEHIASLSEIADAIVLDIVSEIVQNLHREY